MPASPSTLLPAISRFLALSRVWLLGSGPAQPRRRAALAAPATVHWPTHRARLRAVWIAHGLACDQQRGAAQAQPAGERSG